jgi:hypothetical protein
VLEHRTLTFCYFTYLIRNISQFSQDVKDFSADSNLALNFGKLFEEDVCWSIELSDFLFSLC